MFTIKNNHYIWSEVLIMKKEKNYLSVFNFWISPWRYLPNWKSNIKYFFRAFRNARQRATKGFCARDCWAVDEYLLHLLPALLTKFKEDNNGYPYSVDSIEEWNKIIDRMINHFNAAKEGYKNKYDDKYTISEELRDKWLNEEHNIQEYKQKHLEEGFRLLTKYFRYLWW